MKVFNCSIVGLGRIGSTLEDDPLREKPASHAGAIWANSDCRLFSGCDIDKKKCEDFARRWECPHVYTDFYEMLSFQLPDILCIATPPDTHKEFVIASAENNIPLVICEKPLTENVSEADEIIHSISNSSTILMVNHERRYSKDYMHVKKIIEDKIYGDLYSLNCKLYMGRGKTVEEMLWEDGTHMIDILRYLTNREVSSIHITGDLYTQNGESIISLKFDEIYAVIDAACNRDHLVFELDVSFTKGMIKIGNGIYEEYESTTSPFYQNFNSLIKKGIEPFLKTNYFSGMLEDAVHVLKCSGQQTDPKSKGMDGYYAVKVISAILEKSS